MCLNIIYEGKQKREALAKLPESGYYWKGVFRESDGYYPPLMDLPFLAPYKAGWNTTKRKYEGEGYALCFHLLKEKKDAMAWGNTCLRCIIKKKDIVAIGTQSGELTIVTKRFWIPKPKKKPA